MMIQRSSLRTHGRDAIALSVLSLHRAPHSFAASIGDLLVVVSTGGLDALHLRAEVAGSGEFAMTPAIAIVEMLPRAADGSIDFEAAWQQAKRAGSYFPYEPPSTALETQLVRAMEELTGLNPIGVTDDFYRLGIDSLMAIEFLVLTEPLSGGALSLDELMEQGNLRCLATWLAGESARGAL